MDIDPLQDVPPARYAVESDSEDEIGYYPGPKPVRPHHIYNVEVNRASSDKAPLLIACGTTGILWASGITSENAGSIKLDGIQVVEYRRTPSNTEIALLSHRLPLNAQNLVARAIVEAQGNTHPVVIVDSYSYLGYISSQFRRQDEQPVLHLSTSSAPQLQSRSIKPYAPPNLIQNTSAALLAECEYLQLSATTLLIPTRTIEPFAPVKPTKYPSHEDSPPTATAFEAVALEAAATLGVTHEQLGWAGVKIGVRRPTGSAGSRAQFRDTSEGGMYI